MPVLPLLSPEGQIRTDNGASTPAVQKHATSLPGGAGAARKKGPIPKDRPEKFLGEDA
jgi:hypothetical protein